jgi:hypothetical protein
MIFKMALKWQRLRNGESWLTQPFFRPAPLPILLISSFILGVAHASLMFPVPVVLGTAPFWEFPVGTIPGGRIDLAQQLTGYLFLVQAPWGLPLLHVPNLVPPAGYNAFWLDPVPWLGLAGKTIHSITGWTPNLFGAFAFLSFALPGVAMTLLFWTTGRATLLHAVAGSILVNAMPLLLFEWGHNALCAQFLIILALTLYLWTQREPNDRRVTYCWIALLAVTVLTHLYLFVMVGGCWVAAIVQKGLDRRSRPAALLAESAAVIIVIVGLMALAGMISPDLRSSGTSGFGIFSMNLGSPFIPQLSGVIPPLRSYWIGMRSQVLSYPGLGVLLVIVASLPALLGWISRNWRAHAALIAVLAAFLLFAVSNRITLGARVLLEIPLPDSLSYALGTFRASGRFFWPIAYAVTAAAILLVIRTYRPRAALALLGIACVLQLIDADPVRSAIAQSTRHPLDPVFDRGRAERLVAQSRSIVVFPTAGCAPHAMSTGEAPGDDPWHLLQATIELELLAARHNLPVNSVENPRFVADCKAEAVAERQPLQPGSGYFYLTAFTPDPRQLGGRRFADVCEDIEWFRFCQIPQRAE